MCLNVPGDATDVLRARSSVRLETHVGWHCQRVADRHPFTQVLVFDVADSKDATRVFDRRVRLDAPYPLFGAEAPRPQPPPIVRANAAADFDPPGGAWPDLDSSGSGDHVDAGWPGDGDGTLERSLLTLGLRRSSREGECRQHE